MNTESITIQVSQEVARAYLAASEEDRRKLDLLASVQLAEYLKSSDSLQEIMGDTSREAVAAGLTPELVDSSLRETRRSVRLR